MLNILVFLIRFYLVFCSKYREVGVVGFLMIVVYDGNCLIYWKVIVYSLIGILIVMLIL